MQAVIEARSVNKSFGQGQGKVHALKDINFAASKGEFVAVMGPSGCGKSTLLAVLGGLDTPDSGDVLVDSHSLLGMSENDLAVLRRRHIGFVFQAFNLLPVLSAAENVGLPLLLDGLKGTQVQERVQARLAQVGLADRAKHRPGEMSGGQQQRVAIARALVTNPAILLTDEPTGNLDSQNSQEVMQSLRQTCETTKQTIILITHDPAVAAWADRVVFMSDGRLEGELPLHAGAGESRSPAAANVSAIMEAYKALTRPGGV